MVGVGAQPCPQRTNVCKFRNYMKLYLHLRQITFKLDNLTNFKTLLKVVSTGLPYLAHGKS